MDDLFSPRGLSGRTLARSDLASLAGGASQVVTDCDLQEADLSGLDLTGWRFERCNLRKADCGGTKLEGSVWQSCRAPFVSFKVQHALNIAQCHVQNQAQTAWQGF